MSEWLKNLKDTIGEFTAATNQLNKISSGSDKE
jgi:hypothetical protein